MHIVLIEAVIHHSLRTEVIITAPVAMATGTGATAAARPRMPAWVVDVLLGIPVALGAVAPDPYSDRESTPTEWITLALGIAVAASLPLARKYPRTMLAVTTLIAAIVPLWSSSSLGFVLAAAICLYRLAAVTADRRVVVFALLASATVLVASVAIGGPVDRYLAWMLQPLAFLVGAAGLGEATRSRRAYIDAITERAERAERTRELEADRRVNDERLRIARGLHDAAGHQMAAINLNAAVAKNALPKDPERAIEVLSGIQESARAVLGEISALLQLLRGSGGDAGTDSLTPLATWAGIPAVVTEFRRNGLEVSGDLPREIAGLSGAAEIVAYKVVQEGLANARKHGDGRAAVAAQVRDDGLHLRIENLIGVGVDPTPSARFGLLGIRERVESVAGTVSFGREPRGDGTAFVLAVRIPLSRPGAT